MCLEIAFTERYQVIAEESYMVENQVSYIGSYIRIFGKNYIGFLSYRLHRIYPTMLSDLILSFHLII